MFQQKLHQSNENKFLDRHKNLTSSKVIDMFRKVTSAKVEYLFNEERDETAIFATQRGDIGLLTKI